MLRKRAEDKQFSNYTQRKRVSIFSNFFRLLKLSQLLKFSYTFILARLLASASVSLALRLHSCALSILVYYFFNLVALLCVLVQISNFVYLALARFLHNVILSFSASALRLPRFCFRLLVCFRLRLLLLLSVCFCCAALLVCSLARFRLQALARCFRLLLPLPVCFPVCVVSKNNFLNANIVIILILSKKNKLFCK